MAGRLAAAESSFPGLKRVETGGGDDAALGADFHVSLSRPCAIRFHQIESVVGMLKNEFRGQHMSVSLGALRGSLASRNRVVFFFNV